MAEAYQKLQTDLLELQKYAVPVNHELEVYILDAETVIQHRSILDEIGRLRKKAFSKKGAGGRQELDIDAFDQSYNQMFVTRKKRTAGFAGSVKEKEIVAGYRFYIHRSSRTVQLDMARLFDIGAFLSTAGNVPSVELGRSFIVPEYQKHSTIFYSLFCGLGIIYLLSREIKYYFGKITFYPANSGNHNVLKFLQLYHQDTENIIVPHNPVPVVSAMSFSGMTYKQAYRKISKDMPEILSIYLKLTDPQFAPVSGSAPNEDFEKGIIETAFRIYIPAVKEFWKERFIYPFEEAVRTYPVHL